MTAGGTWPSISSALDATIAALDALHERTIERRNRAAAELQERVATLGESSAPWSEEGIIDSPAARPASALLAGRATTPFVPLPERTTHGGDFGPKVRAKLIAEALARGDQW